MRTMKDSGQAWLGPVPEHWQLVPLGRVFRERKTTVSDTDFEPLSVSMGGIVPRMENVALTGNNDSRKLVRKGDYVINSRSDRKGSGGISASDGSVSVISTVLKPVGIEPAYAHHLLRSVAFQEEFYRWGSGIVADLWSTRYAPMSKITLPLPPTQEQVAIAGLLDRETARIDSLIEKQLELIGLLHERRRATVAALVDLEIVTASGAPRLKSYVCSVRQGWSPQCLNWPREGDEWAVLKTGCTNGGVFHPDENKKLPDDIEPRPTTVVHDGDLVVSRANTRELVGSAAVVHGNYPRLMLSDKLYAFDLSERASADFVASLLSTQRYRDLIEMESTGASSSMQNITQDVLRNLPMELPDIETQERVQEEISTANAKIDSLIVKAEQHITLAQERRAALIIAAVTGQLDVPGKVA